ncbi:MAG: hypothetical protein E7422_11310 [Ruminococcaceae bacterium]|nr:hypothetical protein [Oscillospiraceae bacterium]
MKCREKKEIALVASGIILGASIVAPAAGAALTAQPSSQKIVVDGKPVQIEAYSIGGSNYCKLRDVGKAVGFTVAYNALTNTVEIRTTEPYAEEIVAQTANSRTVTLPTDGSRYVPQVGDIILCDDGTEYEIKDTTRWDTNVFQDGPLPPLPTATCDWSAFPTLTLQPPVAKRYNDKYGDTLFVRNVYEVRRMAYTLYNALGDEPEAWRDGKPLFKIYTEIPLEYEPYTDVFWPWRASEITDVVHECPNVRYYIDAYDEYKNGVFLNTRYLFMSI